MEIGGGKRIARLGLEGDEAGRVEGPPPLTTRRFGQEMKIGRDHQRPRLRQLQHGLLQIAARTGERRRVVAREFPGVGRELGMLLPAHRRIGEGDAIVFGGGIGAAMAARRDELTEGGAVAGGELDIGHESEMQDAQRRRDGCERACMHLAQNGAAQRMRFEGHHLSSGKTESGAA